jgi:hypothetical protein
MWEASGADRQQVAYEDVGSESGSPATLRLAGPRAWRDEPQSPRGLVHSLDGRELRSSAPLDLAVENGGNLRPGGRPRGGRDWDHARVRVRTAEASAKTPKSTPPVLEQKQPSETFRRRPICCACPPTVIRSVAAPRMFPRFRQEAPSPYGDRSSGLHFSRVLRVLLLCYYFSRRGSARRPSIRASPSETTNPRAVSWMFVSFRFPVGSQKVRCLACFRGRTGHTPGIEVSRSPGAGPAARTLPARLQAHPRQLAYDHATNRMAHGRLVDEGSGARTTPRPWKSQRGRRVSGP